MGDVNRSQYSGLNDEEASETQPLLRPDQKNRKPNGAHTSQHIEDEWTSEDNQKNPRNWSATFKWITVTLVSFIEFLTTMPNFMYAPNITDAQRDLKTDDETLATFSLTIYVLGFALGPLLFAPLSEVYGRALIYRICLSLFLLCTVGCAASKNIEMLVAFRFLAGCLGAAPVAIGGAVVGDLFVVSERGTAMSVYQAGQIISAVVGPQVGGLVGNLLNWRWVFWIVCILTGLALFLSFLVLRETHAPTLKLAIYGEADDADQKQNIGAALRQALSRPLKLLFKSPVVFFSCLLIFYVIGILNMFLTEISRVFQKYYDMSSAQTSTVYFGLAIGFVLASVIFGLTNDRMMHSLTRRNKGEMRPEFRLPATIAAMPLIAIGLLWYGWTLHYKVHWIVPTVGSGFAGLGITTVQLSITTYMVDSFDAYSASALAAVTMARSVGGSIVPLIGPLLYQKLEQGWGNSVLAAINLVLCIAPVLLYIYGPRWRALFTTDDL